MAKTTSKLTAKQIQSLPPGKRSDGGNLYVRVRKGGSRQFVMLYKADGKQREMGLGGAGPNGISLAQADSVTSRVGRRSAVKDSQFSCCDSILPGPSWEEPKWRRHFCRKSGFAPKGGARCNERPHA